MKEFDIVFPRSREASQRKKIPSESNEKSIHKRIQSLSGDQKSKTRPIKGSCLGLFSNTSSQFPSSTVMSPNMDHMPNFSSFQNTQGLAHALSSFLTRNVTNPNTAKSLEASLKAPLTQHLLEY